mmetsp:Transcript_8722/g.20875  ORF Transcript_8722/g.20875 Transcript_8722/m.20875 type:complete len:237 (+) Transcript_8722:141-851(+)|eukprot:CAMPEP_0113624284 /NCGR_PEP_ID=MMETSP0017_2-20120614/12513_1 /TAXON_ID=2856 /ORGANISM="Cylindrotheca closterium" /LENGTH=236 /DNA_ID=CAMNT_0000534299 /DNA_START=130 /DNA_END=840 /DNA_ORIENTATION=+ /assembly_acc=CAM_ASM_000147
MDQQLRGAISRNGPLEESATQIQALVRGFLCRKDNFVIEVRPGIQRYASYVSALTVEGFASQRSLCSYQLDDDCEESNLADEHPGFEGSKNLENEYHSPIRKPRRIASKESTGSSMFRSNGMITVDEDDDEHPGFTDSPNSDEEPVKRPTRLLSKESIQSGSSWLDEGDLLFSPKTVDAACAPSKKQRSKQLSKMMQIQEMPFGRGQKALEGRKRPKDRPAVVPIRHRSDASKDLL